jgi:uncharacterized protein YlxW (UPF0749 family)
MAQDLKEICPQIVHENSDGYLSVENDKVVYLLLNELKKTNKQIIDLNMKVEDLSKKLEERN